MNAGAWRDLEECLPRARRVGAWAGWLAVVLSSVLLGGCGSREAGRHVVVYAAQDRVYSEPVFAAFTRATGIEVRAVYDNEATKATGLANRLAAEREHPLADVWWSNEEMRTRQLVRRKALDPDWRAFGARRRVLVCRADDHEARTSPPTLTGLTNAAWRGQLALAYPLFGTTTVHFLMLRQRWGDAAWARWCEALMVNRPMIVDGNSQVVRRVVAGDVRLGLTDTDDVEAARREGAAVVSIALPEPEDLVVPNTVALVAGAPHPVEARRLSDYLASESVQKELARGGAVLEVASPVIPGGDDARWAPLLEDLDTTTRRMEALFRR